MSYQAMTRQGGNLKGIWLSERSQSTYSSVTFWKRQDYENSKKISSCWGKGGINRQSTEDFWGTDNTIWYDNDGATLLYTCPNPENIRHQVSPHVNRGLWVMMMFQCGFIGCNKCTTLVRILIVGVRVGWGRGCACVGTKGIWDVSVPSTRFCCEP